jgi:hypothetical protein
MKILELTLVFSAAAALVVWRGVAYYNTTFRPKHL